MEHGNEVLRIEHLHKEFEGNVIINDISLTVHKGEVIVVIGPSGCGKSTLLRCINALEDIQGGQILLDGAPVDRTSKNISRMREKIGMVFQSYDLFPHKTILQNVTLAPIKVQKRKKEDAEKEAVELLDRVGLADRRDDTRKKKRWSFWTVSDWQTAGTTIPDSCPAGRSSVSRSSGHSACTRIFCFWTRSRPRSIRRWYTRFSRLYYRLPVPGAPC